MDNTSDYQQMECSRRRDKNSSKMKEDSSPGESGLKDVSSHMRTKSDITPSLSSSGSGGKSSRSFSLSRSKSIASARDKWKFSNSYGLLPFLNRDLKHNLNQSLEKCSEDSESLRLRLNTESQERQRLEREVGKLVKMNEQFQEELRDQEKGPSDSLSLMYSNLLRKYEALSEEYNKVVKSHNDAVNKTEQYQDQLKQYKNSYENILNERNKYKQQCTQVKVKTVIGSQQILTRSPVN